MNIPVRNVRIVDISRGSTSVPITATAGFLHHHLFCNVLAKKMPELVLSSSYRSYAKQAALYAAWIARRGPRAAPPGASWHHFGSNYPVGRQWALDLKIPGVSPHDWITKLTAVLNAHEFKFHTAATERSPGKDWSTGWVHLQGVHGGGQKYNPGIRAYW